MAALVAAAVPEARFVVIGGGPMRAHLERQAAALGLLDATGGGSGVMRFTGPVYGEELPHELAKLEVVVNPTLRAWAETFCIANIEVMAMGLPLVTFGVGGIGEHVREDGEVGVRVDEPTSEGLSEAVVRLLRDPEDGLRMGKRGRERAVAEFEVGGMVRRYARLYEGGG